MARTFTSVIFALFCFVLAVSASPLNLVSRAALDVFVPRIIKPDSFTVWQTGHIATVIWDASDAPASISNGASVLLRNYGVVAQGFDLRAGNVSFTVPLNVSTGSYTITLFGDSGNVSPDFTILNY